MSPAERVKLSMTITLGDSFEFTEWSHSLANKWILGANNLWYSINGEEFISTEQLYQIYLDWKQQNKS